MKRLLAVIASRRHAERDRLAVMFSHLAGLRVGEIAGLIFDDVLETDGSVTDRVHINPAIAKGGVGRTVFVNKRLQREIRRYLEALPALPGPSAPLFRTQRTVRSRPIRSASCLESFIGRLASKAQPATADDAASLQNSRTAASRPR